MGAGEGGGGPSLPGELRDRQTRIRVKRVMPPVLRKYNRGRSELGKCQLFPHLRKEISCDWNRKGYWGDAIEQGEWVDPGI